MSKFTLVGKTKRGEGVYHQKGSQPVVEREGKYLTDPTPEELEYIYKMFPDLKPDETS